MKLRNPFSGWEALDPQQRTRILKISGLVVGAFALFTLISILSYLFTWTADQSLLGDPDRLSLDVDVHNSGGKMGHQWAWLLVSRDFPAAVRADRALTERKAKLPNMNYSFGSEALHLTGEGSMDIPYRKFTRLVEDKQYCYLFVSRNSVCMMAKDALKPADIMGFAKFMEEKTGLTWRAEKSFLSMSIYDMRQALRDMRKK